MPLLNDFTILFGVSMLLQNLKSAELKMGLIWNDENNFSNLIWL